MKSPAWESSRSFRLWRVAVRDISQVLEEKERELVRVRQEVEALCLVIPLLTEDNAAHITSDDPSLPGHDTNRWPLEIDAAYARLPGLSTYR